MTLHAYQRAPTDHARAAGVADARAIVGLDRRPGAGAWG